MSSFPLFSVMGIEIEYMLVDRDTLNVRPESDLILQALAGTVCNEVELDDIAVSNELVMHVLELKNNGPKAPDAPIAEHFQQGIERLQPVLADHRLQLLPSGAHPWMNPALETQRWPHGNRDIYHQFDRIFNCQGHGWSNLQSMHINLPFASDDEFNQLHNAIRLILPLLPAIAASTPFLDGRYTGMLDTRLDFYEKNQQAIPSICGGVIPEFISSEGEYRDKVLAPMYRDISPHDPKGILQHEWLNSRGVIAKFDYHALEIRIMDSQECVNADIALAKAVFAILQHWQQQSAYYLEKPCERQRLKALYEQTRVHGFDVAVDDRELLRQWQINRSVSNMRQLWSLLIEQVSSSLDINSQRTLEYLLSQGNLAERLLRASGPDHSRTNLARIYRQLGHCLLNNQMFNPS
ncbi:carboxylate-amine ligase [Legionella sp. CNM-4043-24]|uniref:carboxylate-amine ligase n=1 Tax=Legionella sp. CNM-4043-24 TaxID=3421646 RepID=UPI00403A7CC0